MARLLRIAIVLLACAAEARAATPPEFLDLPIHVEAPIAAQLVRGDDGKSRLVYHLFVTSWCTSPLSLFRVEVRDASAGRVLAVYDTAALGRPSMLLQAPRTPVRATSPRQIGPGRTAFLRMWVPVDSGAALPAGLEHRFVFEPVADLSLAEHAPGDTLAILCAPVKVDRRAPIVLGPPLRGGIWRASGGASQNSYHFGEIVQGGRARIPQRFAIDFQKVDSAGSILPNPFPDVIQNAMFYGNRSEVLAVADAEVALIRDSIPENQPTPSGDENMPVALTRRTVAGNQITLRLADGSFAHYAHLVPGNLRVRVGDRVKRGQVIAILGNSGNAKNPHLHFGVTDGPDLNDSEGLSYVFDRYEFYGRQVQGMPDVRARPRECRRVMPLQNSILRFP